MGFQDKERAETIIQRLNNVEEDDDHLYNKFEAIEENDMKTEDFSTYGEGWRGPKREVEIGNFNLISNTIKNDYKPLNQSMASYQVDYLDNE